jgi:chitin-binding protein
VVLKSVSIRFRATRNHWCAIWQLRPDEASTKINGDIMKALRILRGVAALALASGLASAALGHGLVQDPPSRNWVCGFATKPDESGTPRAKTPECAAAFEGTGSGGYQFMSVLTHARGRAAVTPLPQNVCGFNSETFAGGATPWDKPINWPTSPIQAGPKVFTWNISWGPHFDDTEEFRYWITKPGFQFQVGKPLAWTDFEDQAFCVQKYTDATPNANPNVVPKKATTQFDTTCNVPARTGRHVIYGEWGRNQFTFERFHSCMDVAFTPSTGGGDVVKSSISSQPALGTEFAGAGTVLLDARSSTGSNLTYRWSVSAPNNALYTLDTPNASTTNLHMANPSASQAVQIALQVSNGTSTDNSSVAFTHKPAAISSAWRDLGVLSATARTLNAGDSVQVRAVNAAGQDTFVPATPLVLTSANAGSAAWPLALAQAVAAAPGSAVRVGVLGSGDQVQAAANATTNRIYATTASNIGNAFLLVNTATNGGGGGTGIAASYVVSNDWGTGYCANVTVKNNGASTATWSAAMKVQGKLDQMWNATWTQAADTVNFTGPAWQATLAPGASFTSAGFCAKK